MLGQLAPKISGKPFFLWRRLPSYSREMDSLEAIYLNAKIELKQQLKKYLSRNQFSFLSNFQKLFAVVVNGELCLSLFAINHFRRFGDRLALLVSRSLVRQKMKRTRVTTLQRYQAFRPAPRHPRPPRGRSQRRRLCPRPARLLAPFARFYRVGSVPKRLSLDTFDEVDFVFLTN